MQLNEVEEIYGDVINDEKANKPSTPPKGASGNGVSDFNEEQGSENESESYLEIKDAFNL